MVPIMASGVVKKNNNYITHERISQSERERERIDA